MKNKIRVITSIHDEVADLLEIDKEELEIIRAYEEITIYEPDNIHGNKEEYIIESFIYNSKTKSIYLLNYNILYKKQRIEIMYTDFRNYSFTLQNFDAQLEHIYVNKYVDFITEIITEKIDIKLIDSTDISGFRVDKLVFVNRDVIKEVRALLKSQEI